jgi:hypothetical protein
MGLGLWTRSPGRATVCVYASIGAIGAIVAPDDAPPTRAG